MSAAPEFPPGYAAAYVPDRPAARGDAVAAGDGPVREPDYSSDYLLSHRGPWTAAEVLALPDNEYARYEVIDGVLIVSPAARYFHQNACFELAARLKQALKSADLPYRPFIDSNLLIREDTMPRPDVVVVRREVVQRDTVFVGPEDVLLAVEVVSPSSRRDDRLAKPELYAEAGIRMFWRVELEPDVVVVAHELTFSASGKATYKVVATAKEDEVLRIDEPFPLELTPAELVAW